MAASFTMATHRKHCQVNILHPLEAHTEIAMATWDVGTTPGNEYSKGDQFESAALPFSFPRSNPPLPLGLNRQDTHFPIPESPCFPFLHNISRIIQTPPKANLVGTRSNS